MKNIFMTSAIAIAICCPAISATDIASNANSANCTESVLDTTSGTSNLEAKWTANTLNIDWYNGDTKLTSNTCTYDSGITVPSTDPEKTGYTFNGWSIRRAAAAPSCSGVSCYDLSLNGNGYAIRYAHEDNHCYYDMGGLQHVDCSDSKVNDLSLGDWKVFFDYATVKGASYCASNPGNNFAAQGTPSGSGNYCWCKITEIDGNPETFSWVYMYDMSSCLNNCAGICEGSISSDALFRASAYGNTLQQISDCSSITDRNTCYSSYIGATYYRCEWGNSASTCYTAGSTVDDCSKITDENVCNVLRESSDWACFWTGESCDHYYDD